MKQKMHPTKTSLSKYKAKGPFCSYNNVPFQTNQRDVMTMKGDFIASLHTHTYTYIQTYIHTCMYTYTILVQQISLNSKQSPTELSYVTLKVSKTA